MSQSSPNTSGIFPVGYRVLVKPDPLEEKTAGGIIIAEPIREQHDRAQATGRLVAVGAFAWKEWPAGWAKPGDRVLFDKYGGTHMTGEDGELYRLLNDQQVTAIVSEKVNLSDFRKREQYK